MSVRPAKTKIRVFAVRMKKDWVFNYPLSAQGRRWSDWEDGQSDLSLLWAHTHFIGFVMRRLKSIITVLLVGTQSRDKKTCLRGLRPGKTQTGLLSYSD